jgi:hypothetical protein
MEANDMGGTEMRNAYSILVETSENRRPLGRLRHK